VKNLIRFSRLNLQDDSKMPAHEGYGPDFCLQWADILTVASKSKVINHFFANLISAAISFWGHGVTDELNDSFA